MPALLSRRAVMGGLASALAAAAIAPVAAEVETEGLRALADSKGIAFGSAVDGSRLKDRAYAEQLLKECDKAVDAVIAKLGCLSSAELKVAVGLLDRVRQAVEVTTVREELLGEKPSEPESRKTK